MITKELRQKNTAELTGLLKETRRELFKLRMQAATHQLKSVHLIRQKRREVARLQTVLTQQAQEVNA